MSEGIRDFRGSETSLSLTPPDCGTRLVRKSLRLRGAKNSVDMVKRCLSLLIRKKPSGGSQNEIN